MHGYTVKTTPDLEEARGIVSDSLSKKRFTMVVADCRVDYRGRSSSKLGWGERLIMIKPDGSILVHRKSGYEAVNWQPPGCHIAVSIQDGHLLVRADRRTPRETLYILCRGVMLVAALSLVDDAPFDMLLTEQELYQVLLENPHMIEPGFRVASRQKEVKMGLADITGYDDEGNYVVVEVKRVNADAGAVKQLYKYVSEMRETSPNVRGIIVAPGIKPAAKRLARSLSLEYRKVDLKRCVELLLRGGSTEAERLDRHL